MHKSEPIANLTLITHVNKVYELKARTIEVLAPLESNYEVNSTSYYR